MVEQEENKTRDGDARSRKRTTKPKSARQRRLNEVELKALQAVTAELNAVQEQRVRIVQMLELDPQKNYIIGPDGLVLEVGAE